MEYSRYSFMIRSADQSMPYEHKLPILDGEFDLEEVKDQANEYVTDFGGDLQALHVIDRKTGNAVYVAA